MKKLLMTAATVVALASPASALSGTLTNADLLMECLADKGFCHGLLLGLQASGVGCVPHGTGTAGMRDAVLGYLASKRIYRTDYRPTGVSLATEALKDAFPCKQFNFDPVKD